MAIDAFDTARFEAALPAGRWSFVGMQDNERTYHVVPSGLPAHLKGYAIRVRSSIGASGLCDGAGEDSIRCVIVSPDGAPYGAKMVRWTDRRNGWERRMSACLMGLKQNMLRLIPCPSCGVLVVPLVVTKDESPNKGRPFVKCCNEACKKQHFEWTDEAPPAPVTTAKPAAATGAQPAEDAPICPECADHGPMCRMSSGRGWRCNVPGNRWQKGEWTVCQGVVWDKERKAKEAPPAVVIQGGKQVAPLAKVAADLLKAGPVVIQGGSLPVSHELKSKIETTRPAPAAGLPALLTEAADTIEHLAAELDLKVVDEGPQSLLALLIRLRQAAAK